MITKEIAEQFGIMGKNFAPMNHAVLSQVYLIDNKYILRSRTMENDTFMRFESEQRLLERIRQIVRVKFPELLKNNQGENYLIDGQSLWTAYKLISGDIICAWWNLEKLAEEKAKNVFITLRELHAGTVGKLQDININSEYNFTDDVNRRLSDIGNSISPEEQARVQKAVATVQDFKNNLPEKDYCFVHGDYHPGNIVFQGNKAIGLLDTDWSRKGSYLEDLAYTAMMFLRDYRQPFKFIVENYQKFLAWYGIDAKDTRIFNEYLILYTFYDLHLFRDLIQLPNRDLTYEYQKEFLRDLCLRF